MSKVTTEKVGHVLKIGLNRPDKMNAADEELLHGLALAYGELEKDKELRVGLLFAHGDHFTAGLDLFDVGPKMQSGKLQLVPEGGIDPWGIQTKQVSKPVVMAIRGTCFTLGVELALASDIVIAASDSKFGQLEVARGILPFGGGTIRLPKVAGHAKAMQYLLTGETFSAQDALQMGMIFKIYPTGLFEEEVMSLASTLAQMPTKAIGLTKRLLNQSMTNNLEQQMALESDLQIEASSSNDYKEGVTAFVEKRIPKFKGN